LGLSGIDFADEFAGQHAALSACLGIAPERLTLVNDGVAALWGASVAACAGIVHHGSGVTHAYRAGFGNEQPYDHLDVGHLFDIRYALAALVARMIDGRAPVTPLKAAVLAHYGIADEAEYAAELYRRRIPRELHRTAQGHAFAAWLAGDPEATRLVESAAADYALTAAALVHRTGDPRAEVAFGGGVLNHAPEEFHALLVERVGELAPEAVVVRPRLSPGHGAALMAAFHHGVEVGPAWERMLGGSEAERMTQCA
jgi:N-acetylglucosamine kinase-like BadF-type ATPase